MEGVLKGIRVVNLSLYLPGPLAASRLQEMGAEVTKIEPPGGDPLRHYHLDWFNELHTNQTFITMDLKSPEGKESFSKLLDKADLLITNLRPAALERLGIIWSNLKNRYPNLICIHIVGYGGADADLPSHDLNFQAKAGLLVSNELPVLLIGDIAGAESAVTESLKLLYAREKGLKERFSEVSMTTAAKRFAMPLRYGDTDPDKLIGGGFVGYGVYEAKEGRIAVATLEPKFWKVLVKEANLSEKPSLAEFKHAMKQKTADEWERFARKTAIPVVKVTELQGK